VKRRALVLGCTGQDGSYLCELLLSKKYEVHGTIRRSSSFNTARIDHIFDRLSLHYADLTDGNSLLRVIQDVYPEEIYSLGAMSHVRTSFDIPLYTGDVTGLGALRLFEAARTVNRNVKIYQASSSEMFGSSSAPQNETTPFHPRSPYGVAKVFAFQSGVNYREAYDMFICNGILFNHEGPRRTETFVTRKIVRGLCQIKNGDTKPLVLGNLDARRDWGYAPEFVEAMWLMLQQKDPDDFVIATGEAHTVREFLDATADYLQMDWKPYVKIDAKYFRPAEVDLLLGDASKAKRVLGWESKVRFKDLVKIMVDAELHGE